jgi:cardiolipin synthase
LPSGLSDTADGFLAKRFGLDSPLGRVLDDRRQEHLAAFVTLAILDDVPVWLAALVITRDVLILLGLAIAMALRVPIAVQPLLIGKLCTALQVLYIGLHLASLAFEFPLGAAVSPADAYLVGGVALASGFAYSAVWLKAMRAVWIEYGRRA